MQISVSREGKKNIYIRAGFFNNLTAKIEHSSPQTVFFFQKEISKEVNIKTRSAAIAFFFLFFSYFLSPSLFLLSLSSFFSRKIFGLILPSAFGLFRSVRFQISSKIMLWRLLLPIH